MTTASRRASLSSWSTSSEEYWKKARKVAEAHPNHAERVGEPPRHCLGGNSERQTTTGAGQSPVRRELRRGGAQDLQPQGVDARGAPRRGRTASVRDGPVEQAPSRADIESQPHCRESWPQLFAQLWGQHWGQCDSPPPAPARPQNPPDLTFDSLQTALAKVRGRRNAPGPDGMHYTIFRDTPDDIAQKLRVGLQNRANSAGTPKDPWGSACVTFTAKKKHPTAAARWRPISVRDHCKKLYELTLLAEPKSKPNSGCPPRYSVLAPPPGCSSVCVVAHEVAMHEVLGEPLYVAKLDINTAFGNSGAV